MLENLRTFVQSLRDARAEKRDERGASAVEYGLLVALIAVAIILAVATLGGTLGDIFDNTNEQIGVGAGGGDPE